MADVPALELCEFGVAFGKQVVLSGITLACQARSMSVLLGPAGAGKSTLLRTLSGLNDAHPALRTWGHASFSHGGEAPERPRLVHQGARFYVDTVRENLVSALPERGALDQRQQLLRLQEQLERLGASDLLARASDQAVQLPLGAQRRLAIIRALLSDPAVLLVDEPTAGLPGDEAQTILSLLGEQAEKRAVLLTTHHRGHALAVGGQAHLLVEGRIRASAPTAEFFRAPPNELAERFVRTGGCTLPPRINEAAATEAFATEAPAEPKRPTKAPPSDAGYPRGFYWLLPRRLGGLPRPGIIDSDVRDVAGLQALGVTVLVTLEERATVDAELLRLAGIRSAHFPIVDMSAPGVEDAVRFCAEVDGWLRHGEVVALHCLAGQGRTGTMLAAYLIRGGAPCAQAIETVRCINPRCVQSEAQVHFLEALAAEREPSAHQLH